MNQTNRTHQLPGKRPAQRLVGAALIAALYAAATYASAAAGLAYGGVQFRFSEALTILPVFTPYAIPGLTIGCLLGNLASPLGLADILCGTAASLIAACLTRLLRNIKPGGIPWLACLPPVLVNALIVGAELALLTAPSGGFWPAFGLFALQVGAGQLVCCCGLGIPLYLLLRKTGAARYL